MRKLISLALAMLMLFSLFALSGCNKVDNSGPSTKLSFSDTNMNDIKKLDGQLVTITGYMSTLSPIDGSFMYLLNLPYQSCPFCEPNTTTLSNTVAIYAPKNDGFKFTDRLIRVTGTLEYKSVGSFSDEYGYNYKFRIVDATYEVVDTSELGEHLQLWQELAATGVIADVYAMYDYINFLCFWGTYTAQFDGGSDYLYAADLQWFLYGENAQYNYGLASNYFSKMITTIESVDKTAFADLVANIKAAETFAREVEKAIANGEYEQVAEYTKDPSTGRLVFGDGRSQFRMKDYQRYDVTMNNLIQGFATWLAEWEV